MSVLKNNLCQKFEKGALITGATLPDLTRKVFVAQSPLIRQLFSEARFSEAPLFSSLFLLSFTYLAEEQVPLRSLPALIEFASLNNVKEQGF